MQFHFLIKRREKARLLVMRRPYDSENMPIVEKPLVSMPTSINGINRSKERSIRPFGCDSSESANWFRNITAGNNATNIRYSAPRVMQYLIIDEKHRVWKVIVDRYLALTLVSHD